MAQAKARKGPGTPIDLYVDFLGQEIRVGDHVVVLGMVGRSASGYSAQVIDIHEVPIKYARNPGATEIKLCCEPTGAYSGSCHHDWPTEEDVWETQVQGRTVWKATGERPRAHWIMSRNVLRSPVQEPPADIKRRGWR